MNGTSAGCPADLSACANRTSGSPSDGAARAPPRRRTDGREGRRATDESAPSRATDEDERRMAVESARKEQQREGEREQAKRARAGGRSKKELEGRRVTRGQRAGCGCVWPSAENGDARAGAAAARLARRRTKGSRSPQRKAKGLRAGRRKVERRRAGDGWKRIAERRRTGAKGVD